MPGPGTGEALKHLTAAVTGAIGTVSVNGRLVSTNTPLHLRPGDMLRLGPPRTGLRYYLAVTGGILTPEVLGSCSFDTLGGLGPPPLRTDQVLDTGSDRAGHPLVDHVPAAPPATTFEVMAGPDGDESAVRPHRGAPAG
jgi:allophanate hydrolase subunit 2